MRKLDLPQLPAGYFWQVRNEAYPVPMYSMPPTLVVQIRRKTRWFSRVVDSMHSVLEHATYEDEVQHCARILHDRFIHAQVQHAKAHGIAGDYA